MTPKEKLKQLTDDLLGQKDHLIEKGDRDMKTIKITKETIDAIFDTATHQVDATIALYQAAFPNWESIDAIDGWPKVHKGTNKYIFRKFVVLDETHHPDVFKGGLWLNMGFSTLDNEHLNEWEIDTSNCILTYKA